MSRRKRKKQPPRPLRKYRPKNLKAKLWMAATADVTRPCHWCGAEFHSDELVADHEPPLSSPGGTPHGAVLACKACDLKRSGETSRARNAERPTGKAHKSRKKRKRDGG